jgi:hypothetical protein
LKTMGRRRRSVIDAVVIVTLKNTQVSSKPIYRHLALYRPCKKTDISALGIVRVKEILINKPQPWCHNVIFACLLWFFSMYLWWQSNRWISKPIKNLNFNFNNDNNTSMVRLSNNHNDNNTYGTFIK